MHIAFSRGRQRKVPNGEMRHLRAAQNNAGNMRHIFRGYRQAVRHGILAPASPVRIWLAQFGKHLASHTCDLALAESPLAASTILLRTERDRPPVFIEHHPTMLDCQ